MFRPTPRIHSTTTPSVRLWRTFFDFDAIRKSDGCKLFLAATHVLSGKIRIFHNREITADALMATSCVPTMFQAVEVDGEYYWDGGYVANPAIFPLDRGMRRLGHRAGFQLTNSRVAGFRGRQRRSRSAFEKSRSTPA